MVLKHNSFTLGKPGPGGAQRKAKQMLCKACDSVLHGIKHERRRSIFYRAPSHKTKLEEQQHHALSVRLLQAWPRLAQLWWHRARRSASALTLHLSKLYFRVWLTNYIQKCLQACNGEPGA